MIYSSEFNLSPFINEIIKVFSKHHCKDLEEKLKKISRDNHVISSQKEIARKDFIPNLEYSLDNIKGDMVTFADYTARLSKQVQWHQASRGVPEFFEGGYSFSVIICDSGLVPSKKSVWVFFCKTKMLITPHMHMKQRNFI